MSEFKENDHRSENPPKDDSGDQRASFSPLYHEEVVCQRSFSGIKNSLPIDVIAYLPGKTNGKKIAMGTNPVPIDPALFFTPLSKTNPYHLRFEWEKMVGSLEKAWVWCDKECTLMYSLEGLGINGEKCHIRKANASGKWILTIEPDPNCDRKVAPWIVGEVDDPAVPQGDGKAKDQKA